MKKLLVPLAAALAVVGAAPLAASGTPAKAATLVIRHQLRGCHAWSVNGGPYRVVQSVKLARGGALVVTNNDVMPQTLAKTSGPAVKYVKVRESHMGPMIGLKGTFPPQALAHMGATAKVVFPRDGVYRFVTKPGEDYMPGLKTVGEDNHLRLTVIVS